MSSIKDQVRAGMATWPSFKDFMYMLVGGAILGGIGGLIWGALQDAWHSSNPWIHITAGAVIAIGAVIWFILCFLAEFCSGESEPSPSANKRNNEAQPRDGAPG